MIFCDAYLSSAIDFLWPSRCGAALCEGMLDSKVEFWIICGDCLPLMLLLSVNVDCVNYTPPLPEVFVASRLWFEFLL